MGLVGLGYGKKVSIRLSGCFTAFDFCKDLRFVGTRDSKVRRRLLCNTRLQLLLYCFFQYFPLFIVRPENARIQSKREPLSAGKDYVLECTSHGSRPPATITWWKNSKFLNNAESQVSTFLSKL